MRNKLIGVLLVVVVVLAGVYLALGYVIFDRLTTVVEGQSINQPNTPADFKVRGGPYIAFDTTPYEMPNYVLVRFPSRQAGVTLAGWYIEGSPSRAGGDRHARLSALQVRLERANAGGDASPQRFQCPDDRPPQPRAIGRRERTRGVREYRVAGRTGRMGLAGGAEEFHAAADRAVRGIDGAATSLIAFAQEPRVAAAFTDSSFIDLGELIDDELQSMRLPTFLSYGGFFMARIVGGEDLRVHTPREGIIKDAGRPLYLVHGTADQKVDYHHNRELAALAQQTGANATFWVVDGAGHVESVFHSPAEYEQRMSAFFRAALGK